MQAFLHSKIDAIQNSPDMAINQKHLGNKLSDNISNSVLRNSKLKKIERDHSQLETPKTVKSKLYSALNPSKFKSKQFTKALLILLQMEGSLKQQPHSINSLNEQWSSLANQNIIHCGSHLLHLCIILAFLKIIKYSSLGIGLLASFSSKSRA